MNYFNASDCAIFPGSFDPIHNGHLSLAEQSCSYYGWAHIYFIPSSHFLNRSSSPHLSGQWRLQLCRAALDERQQEQLVLLEHEIINNRPGYLIDTVRYIRDMFPESEQGSDTRINVLLGSDLLPEIHTWKAVEELAKLVHFYFLHRPETQVSHSVLQKYDLHYTFVPTPTYDISSTEVRKRIELGKSISDLVPQKVEKLIAQHHLYSRVGQTT